MSETQKTDTQKVITMVSEEKNVEANNGEGYRLDDRKRPDQKANGDNPNGGGGNGGNGANGNGANGNGANGNDANGNGVGGNGVTQDDAEKSGAKKGGRIHLDHHGQPFQRVNFFHGLFMRAEDWQNEQRYHMEKLRYHVRHLHGPAVPKRPADNLDITVNETGDGILVAPGYAVDGNGHDLFVHKKRNIPLPPRSKYENCDYLYLGIRRGDQDHSNARRDERPNPPNPAHKGFAYIKEEPIIQFTCTEPDNVDVVQLARIKIPDLDSGVPLVLTDTDLSNGTQAGEIDTGDRVGQDDGGKGGLSPSRSIQYEIDIPVDKPGKNNGKKNGNSAGKLRDIPGFLLEITDLDDLEPFYIVHAHVLGRGSFQWWIERTEVNQKYQYHIRFKNNHHDTIKVKCRILKIDHGSLM